MDSDKIRQLLIEGKLDQVIEEVDKLENPDQDSRIRKAAAYIQKHQLEDAIELINSVKLERKSQELSYLDLNIAIYEAMYYTNKRKYLEGIEVLETAISDYEIISQNEESNLHTLSGIYHQLAILYSYKGDLEKSLDLNKKALEIRQEDGDPLYISYSLNSIGIIYRMMGKYQDSFDYFSQCLEIREKLGNKNSIAAVEVNLSTLLETIGNFELAKKHLRRGIDIFKQLNYQKRLIISKYALSSFHVRLGEYTQAISIAKETLEDSKKMDDPYLIANSHHNLATFYKQIGKINLAGEHYQNSLRIKRELGNQLEIATTLEEYADYYFLNGETMKGIGFLEKSLTITETADHPLLMLTAYLKLIIHSPDKTSMLKYYDKVKKIQLQHQDDNIIVLSNLVQMINAIVLIKKDGSDSIKEATDILEELIEANNIEFPHKVIVMHSLIECKILLLEEFEDLFILNEINSYISRLYDLANEEKNWNLLLGTKIFESRLKSVEFKISEGKKILEEVKKLSLKMGLSYYKIQAIEGLNYLESEREKWQRFQSEALPLNQRIKEAKLLELFKSQKETIQSIV